MTSFEPYMARYRTGSEPDRFLREMREAGMATGLADDEDPPEGPEDDLVAALEMATRALGIRLPEELALGPLLTAS